MKGLLLVALGFVLVNSVQVSASVEHVRFADGTSRTLYQIQIPPSVSPDQVDSVTILLNGDPLPYVQDDFELWGFGSFLSGVLWVEDKPALGNYTFILNIGGADVTTYDSQTVNRDIPSVDVNTLSVMGNTFSWGAVSFLGTPLYYRLVIDDSSGNRVYNSNRELNMLSHTIPPNVLVTGRTYNWYVRVSDAADWVPEQNRSNSQVVQFSYMGLDSVLLRQRVWGDGAIENQMQFQLKDASGENLTRSVSLSEITIYDPENQKVNLTGLNFYDVTIGTYNAQAEQWDYPSPPFDPYGHAIFSDSLMVGLYTIEVKHNGQTYAGSSYFNGPVSLPKVDPSSFVLSGDPSGNLTWDWSLPEGLCSQFAVYTPPLIAVYQEGQQIGLFFFRVPNGQCISSLFLPASFVQAINSMADEIRLLVDIRTNTQNNASLSLPLTLTQLTPPALARVQGKVTDAITAEPVAGATISLEPGPIVLTTQTDGTFSSSGIPSGTYSVQISASDYKSKTKPEVVLAPGLSNELTTRLDPYVPKVMSTSASPNEVGNDGQAKTRLTARITHPVGLSNIDTVIADLSPIGGSAEQILYDNGTHGDQTAGDGIYSYQATVAKGTKAKFYALNVTAIDVAGKEGPGSVSLSVKDKQSGTVQPNESRSQNFDNTLGGQTLKIHFIFAKAVLGLKALKSDCQVELTVLGPNGEEYGPYYGTDSIDVSIPNAAEGEWEYVTENPCDSALSYEVETSGSGTGMLVGRVVDGLTGVGVKGATINCNTGGSTVSLAQGYYSSVAVAGTGQVITTKAGYQKNVRQGVHVKAGGTTSLNIQVVPENASAQAVPSGVHIFNVLDPAEDPKPPIQPFAIKVSGSGLEFNLVFPKYQQAVDLYLAFVPSSGAHAGKLFLIDENDSIVEFGGTLHAWKKASTQEESGQIPIPGDYPLGAYTLYSLVTTDSSTLTNFDLSYFTTTPPQPPPVGQNVTFIPSPTEEPDPLTQLLGAKITGGNLILNAHFPMQKEPVSIFLAYMTPAGALYLIKSDGTAELLSGALSPWRHDVTGEVSAQAFSIPTNQMSPGAYYFFSLVTTDPVSFLNFDLMFFSKNVTQ